MHALGLYLDELKRTALAAPAEDALSHANQCADAMNEMFVALLDVSLLDSGTVVPRIEVFSLGAMMERLGVEFETQAAAKGLTLRVAACSAWVRCDPTMLERILRNLVSNAVRYTDTGTILLGCRRRGEQVRVEVWDTGPGIAPDQQRAIFEEFYQVGNRERDRSKGLGLGLAIVERETRLLGIPLTLCSEPGRGSVFGVSLAVAAQGPGEERSPPARDGDGNVDLRGTRILLIDYEPMICDATRILLEQWGCLVVTAASSDEAIASWASLPGIPDVLICDYRLPGENGDQAILKIRTEFNEEIPALLVTGDTSSECIGQMKASACPVLHKPIRAHELKREIARLLIDPKPFAGTTR
jgi:CheY-like chemotaxis protein